jgi:pimeloyl-ACP methyl ester carboxylesterase
VAARGRRAAVHPALAVGLATIADLAAARADRIGGGSVIRLLEGADTGSEAALADASPIERLPLNVPQILAHAEDDDIVPPAQSVGYAAAARSAGDDVELLQPERGGHFGLIDPRSPEWGAVATLVCRKL